MPPLQVQIDLGEAREKWMVLREHWAIRGDEVGK